MTRYEKTVTILIVDDEPLAREGIRDLLDDFPMLNIAGEATSVQTAIAAIAGCHPDILLVDYHLPDGNAQDILTLCDPKRAIIFSADHRIGDELTDTGILFIPKPLSRTTLRYALNRY